MFFSHSCRHWSGEETLTERPESSAPRPISSTHELSTPQPSIILNSQSMLHSVRKETPILRFSVHTYSSNDSFPFASLLSSARAFLLEDKCIFCFIVRISSQYNASFYCFDFMSVNFSRSINVASKIYGLALALLSLTMLIIFIRWCSCSLCYVFS